MNITYIMPGSGGTFYCQNCERDYFLIRALEKEGHTVTVVPLYLPYMQNGKALWPDIPVFYGALNVYLETLFPPYRSVPRFFKKIMDGKPLLKLIAKRSGTVSAEGLEEMTLAMMEAEAVRGGREFSRMVRWMESRPRPDVIHIANTLLSGFIRPLKEHFDVPVLCMVQDEHTWISSMRGRYIDRVWKTMGDECSHADALLSVSRYYTDYLTERIAVPKGLLRTIHLGVPVLPGLPPRKPVDPPVIGFMGRLCHGMGLEILVRSFIRLRRDGGFGRVRLRLTGGNTGEDAGFIRRMMGELETAGLKDSVSVIPVGTYGARSDFLKGLSVLCVPVQEPLAYPLFLLEALAVGVPVVMSAQGAMPELAESVGGAVCFEPDTPEACAAALARLLTDPDSARSMGRQGQANVCKLNTDTVMAGEVVKIYEELIN